MIIINTKLLGRWGENLAAQYLKSKKYTIIGVGYMTRFGEIDIIAEDKINLVFVEVKMRKNSLFAEAREFVIKSKQEKIIKTATLWLSQNESSKQPRFDVIEVYAPDGEKTISPEINHIINAFSL